MSKMVSLKTATEMGYGSRSTLMRRIRNGELPSVMDGKRRMISVDDLTENYEKHHPDIVDKDKAYDHIVRSVCAQAPSLTDTQRQTIIDILRANW